MKEKKSKEPVISWDEMVMIIAMRKQNKSFTQMSEVIGVPRSLIQNYAKKVDAMTEKQRKDYHIKEFDKARKGK